MNEGYRPYIVQTVEKPLGDSSDPLSQRHTLGIKWDWRGDLFGFWGVVRDREEALVNVATLFYRTVKRQQRNDHWYWRVLYWMGDCIGRLVAQPNRSIELEEAEEILPHF